MVTDMFMRRRSVRNYTGESIPDEILKQILLVGLLSESGRDKRPWEFIVVTDSEKLKALTDFKTGSGKILSDAGAAVLIVADTTVSDLYIEDCAIAAANMHLAASELGIASCYINCRNRKAVHGGTVEEYLTGRFGLAENYTPVCMLAFGIPSGETPWHKESDADWSKVHYE